MTAGCGLAQHWGGPIGEVRPADVIGFPPGEKHGHGATATTAMTHIGIQEQLDGKAVDWAEKVSDEWSSGQQISRALCHPATTMPAMSTAFGQLLEATIHHLEDLQARGVRHVRVSPEALRALSQPDPAGGMPDSSRPPAAELPLRPTAPAAGALDSEAKTAAFAALRERVLVCVKCPHLAATRRNVVFGVGNLDAELMFIGEAPGADEDRQGEPFVGKAGQLLTRILQTMGFERADVYIANILKCRPDMPAGSVGNRKPTASEMETCLPYLHEQIDLIQPRVIVALGATAVEGLLGKSAGITKLRGHWRTYRGIPLMPTYHPAFLLRTESLRDKRLVWEDMLQVMEKLGRTISEKQRRFFLKA